MGPNLPPGRHVWHRPWAAISRQEDQTPIQMKGGKESWEPSVKCDGNRVKGRVNKV